eukprot:scaffold67968_cov15-Tisochrysis_lutea.AAC.1
MTTPNDQLSSALICPANKYSVNGLVDSWGARNGQRQGLLISLLDPLGKPGKKCKACPGYRSLVMEAGALQSKHLTPG